jgi:hypothetical protein
LHGLSVITFPANSATKRLMTPDRGIPLPDKGNGDLGRTGFGSVDTKPKGFSP